MCKHVWSNKNTCLCVYKSSHTYCCAVMSHNKFIFARQIILTPCLQACSLSARTQALCQCSLKDLNVKSDDKRPLTPASVLLPAPSRPSLNLRRDPHTPPVRVWWVRLRGSCQGVSLLPRPLVGHLGRSKASEN